MGCILYISLPRQRTQKHLSCNRTDFENLLGSFSAGGIKCRVVRLCKLFIFSARRLNDILDPVGSTRGDEADNWCYFVSRGHLCLYILNRMENWTGVTDALLTHWLTDFERKCCSASYKYKSGALVTQKVSYFKMILVDCPTQLICTWIFICFCGTSVHP